MRQGTGRPEQFPEHEHHTRADFLDKFTRRRQPTVMIQRPDALENLIFLIFSHFFGGGGGKERTSRGPSRNRMKTSLLPSLSERRSAHALKVPNRRPRTPRPARFSFPSPLPPLPPEPQAATHTVRSTHVRQSQSGDSAQLCPCVATAVEVVDQDWQLGSAFKFGCGAGLPEAVCSGALCTFGLAQDQSGTGLLRGGSWAILDTEGKQVSVVRSPNRCPGSIAHHHKEKDKLGRRTQRERGCWEPGR